MFYTRNGDDGYTSLAGARVLKSSEICQLFGSIDELNTFLGLCAVKSYGIPELCSLESLFVLLQKNLFMIQSQVYFLSIFCVSKLDTIQVNNLIKNIEEQIKIFSRDIGPIHNFCAAGGTEISALCDYARTLARRAERDLVAYSKSFLSEQKNISNKYFVFLFAYFNRLSSLLFVLARYANVCLGVKNITQSLCT